MTVLIGAWRCDPWALGPCGFAVKYYLGLASHRLAGAAGRFGICEALKSRRGWDDDIEAWRRPAVFGGLIGADTCDGSIVEPVPELLAIDLVVSRVAV